jgi:hypothetical protein
VSRHITCQFPDGTVEHRWEDGLLEVGSTLTIRGGVWVVSVVDPYVSGRYLLERHAGEAKAVRRPRPIPTPWVDCRQCSWRHYPSAVRGQAGWDVAAACSNCGAMLPLTAP